MLQEMRDRTDSLFFKIIVGALIFVLCAFGFGAFNFFVNPDPAAATVNGDDIKRSELDQFAERRRQQMLAQLGDNADPDLVDVAALRSSSLDMLVEQKLLDQAVDEMGLQVSDYQIDKALTSDPNFQIDGVFDANTYRMLLANNGLTPVRFRELTAGSLVQRQLSASFGSTPVLYDWELDQAAALFGQTRDIAYLLLEKSAAEAAAEVTDDEIEAYYEANSPDYMTDETVTVNYVRRSLAELMLLPEFAPTEEELQATYDEAKAEFEPEERRRAVHILVEVNDERDEAEATRIITEARERIEAGESFATLATELSDDAGSKVNGGDLGFATRGVYVGPFEEALFALGLNELSAPVVTQFGVHLIRLEESELTSYPEFDQQRALLDSQIRRTAATEQLDEMTREMDEIARESNSLEELVAEFELTLETATGVSRNAGAGIFSDGALRAAAFDTEVLDDGFNSEALRTSDDAVVVLRIEDQQVPELKPLAEVRDSIVAQLKSDAATLALEAQASELYDQLLAGSATTAIARESGLRWERVEAAKRQETGAPREVVQTAFTVNRPGEGERSVGQATLANGDRALVVVRAVRDGSRGALTSAELEAVKNQITRLSSDLEFDGFQRTLRDSASVRRAL